MKKKSGLVLLGILSAIAGGGFLIGNKLYDVALVPQHHNDEADSCAEITEGRKFVRQHPAKRDIYIDSIDHLKLHAAYIPADKENHKYIIIIHGIHASYTAGGIYAKHFLTKGISVLMPDLRGFGESEGEYAGYGVDDRFDIVEWIYWIIKRDKDAEIVLHGASMGAATALMVSGEKLPGNVKAIISDSAYTSAVDEFKAVYAGMTGSNYFPVSIAMMLLKMEIKLRAGYDINDAQPIKAVKKSKTPILFIHGDDDNFISKKMMQKLFDAAQCPKDSCMILGADHILGVVVDPETYYKKVDSFLAKNGIL